MSSQPERANQEVLGNEAQDIGVTPEIDTTIDTTIEINDWTIEGIGRDLTPLQYHYLSLLKRLIATKDSYQTDPNYEAPMMSAINKAVYSTLRDSIEANVGDEAKELLSREQHVN